MTDPSAVTVIEQMLELLGAHRVWDRFEVSA